MNITTRITAVLTLGSALALITACGGKKEEAAAPTPQPAMPAATAPAVPTPAPVAETAPAPAQPTSVVATVDKAQTLLEKIKALIAEKKYTEALAALNELSTLKLTPDQQTMAADLKSQVEKAAAQQATTEATKSIGGLLGK